MNTQRDTNANRTSRKLWSGLGIIVLGMGMFLGGCAQNKMSREDLEKENAQLRQQDQEMQAKLAAEANARAAMEAENNSMKARLAAQPPMPAASDEGMPPRASEHTRAHRAERDAERFEVSGDVLFASGQAKLKQGARTALNKIISKIKHEYSGREIRVEGHTDSDPVRKSKWHSNEALSKARAEAVREYMASHGISRRLIEAVGKGSSEPRSTKALSRRVEIIVVE